MSVNTETVIEYARLDVVTPVSPSPENTVSANTANKSSIISVAIRIGTSSLVSKFFCSTILIIKAVDVMARIAPM